VSIHLAAVRALFVSPLRILLILSYNIECASFVGYQNKPVTGHGSGDDVHTPKMVGFPLFLLSSIDL
jgi:hypothetical protein